MGSHEITWDHMRSHAEHACICMHHPCRYADFAPMFKAELFDPDVWATVIKNAGAKCEFTI